jgi:hypothetical protein
MSLDYNKLFLLNTTFISGKNNRDAKEAGSGTNET